MFQLEFAVAGDVVGAHEFEQHIYRRGAAAVLQVRGVEDIRALCVGQFARLGDLHRHECRPEGVAALQTLRQVQGQGKAAQQVRHRNRT